MPPIGTDPLIAGLPFAPLPVDPTIGNVPAYSLCAFAADGTTNVTLALALENDGSVVGIFASAVQAGTDKFGYVISGRGLIVPMYYDGTADIDPGNPVGMSATTDGACGPAASGTNGFGVTLDGALAAAGIGTMRVLFYGAGSGSGGGGGIAGTTQPDQVAVGDESNPNTITSSSGFNASGNFLWGDGQIELSSDNMSTCGLQAINGGVTSVFTDTQITLNNKSPEASGGGSGNPAFFRSVGPSGAWVSQNIEETQNFTTLVYGVRADGSTITNFVSPLQATIASAATIVPVAAQNHVTGATPISTITPPGVLVNLNQHPTGRLVLIMDSNATFSTGGNINAAAVAAANAIVAAAVAAGGKAKVVFDFDGTTWF